MATTTTVVGAALAKNHHEGAAVDLWEFAVKVTGTYATASKPSFDILAAIQASTQQGVSAVSVKTISAFADYNDGTNVYTASNSANVLSGTGNKVSTFTVESGATNGDTGTEVIDGTVLGGIFSFIAAVVITPAL